nr:MAG TPA: hypothetical protein [Caudoviricetes sp.]
MDADCQLLAEVEDSIFNVLSDGLSDDAIEEVFGCMKKNDAKRIFEIHRLEGAA